MQTNIQEIGVKVQQATKRKSRWKKRTAALSRWLHLYLSMVCFVVVLFFAVTGLTLNHTEWFDGKQVEKKYEGKLPVAWVNNADTSKVQKLDIVEFLRSRYGVKGYVSDFLIEDEQISVSFKGPGYSADAFVKRNDGSLQLSELRMGVFAVLNDLHKGRDSGKGWGWLIDVSAVLLTLVSLTGLLMLLFLKKRRLNGLIVTVVGGIICYLIYLLYVP
ncbi:MAG TPA: PepSY-associated TM helix domain-containing protein [Flavisolibacter sp.]|jgi:hypothetical protein